LGRSICILEEWQAREILAKLKERYSVRKLAGLLGVSKSTVHRVIRGEQRPPAILRIRLCELLPEEELLQILKGPQLLRQYGLVDDEGRVNKALALALIDALMQDSAAKEELLSYLLKYYKRELTERLAETLPKITLKLSKDFERWLTEKKSKPISERTLRDYKNVWNLCLEGKTLGWHLLKQLEGSRMLCHDGKYHPTGWTRQIFRHYIRFLYTQGRLDWDTYTRLLLLIPGRRYGRKVSQKVINVEDVRRTLLLLKEKRDDIYMLYLLMLFSAVRFEHALRALKEWRPGEQVYIDYLSRTVTRLECKQDFCRYYLGRENEIKPAGFMYFPKSLLLPIEKYGHKLPNKRRIEKVVAKLGGLMPKYIRIYAIREMKKVFGDNDVFRFITSKFGELTVSARHYLDLLEEADKIYPRYIEHIYTMMGDVVRAEI
jgi:intergrase/recombinase/DNA-binding XRE family transcriptional regulator